MCLLFTAVCKIQMFLLMLTFKGHAHLCSKCHAYSAWNIRKCIKLQRGKWHFWHKSWARWLIFDWIYCSDWPEICCSCYCRNPALFTMLPDLKKKIVEKYFIFIMSYVAWKWSKSTDQLVKNTQRTWPQSWKENGSAVGNSWASFGQEVNDASYMVNEVNAGWPHTANMCSEYCTIRN